MSLIVLDPGHGGVAFIGSNGKRYDSSPNNAVGPTYGLLEKDLTLEIGLLASEHLLDLGHQVILTRSTDVNVKLVDRAAIAKSNDAPVFVSIHFNGSGDTSARYTSIWLDNGQRTDTKSYNLALAVVDRVANAAQLPKGSHEDGVYSEELGVLKPVNHSYLTAACLAELSFLSNPEEEERLKNEPGYLATLARALANGIDDYLATAFPSKPSFTASHPEPLSEVVASILGERPFYHSPVNRDSTITIDSFGPYNAGTAQNPDWRFRTSMNFTAASATAPFVYAMASGCLYYRPAGTQGASSVVLLRADPYGVFVATTIGILPSWFPQPGCFVYANVPEDASRAAARLLLRSPSQMDTAISLLRRRGTQLTAPETQGEKDAMAEHLADLWLTGGLPDGIFATAGERIGAFGTATAGEFSVEISMVHNIDPVPDRWYNPCYFLAAWNELGILRDSDVFPEFLSMEGPPAGNGVIHTVSGGGAAIGQALALAVAGDTILITDSETYSEELVIGKGVNIMGVGNALKSSDILDPLNALGNFIDYPTLTGNRLLRPVAFEAVTDGVAYLGRVRVTEGRVNTTAIPFDGPALSGGGILINKADRVVISSCFIESCDTQNPGLVNAGNGGGIYIHHSSPAILCSVVRDNVSAGRGGGVAAYGYGWPTLYSCRISNNETSFDGGDGGGVAIQVAVPKLASLPTLGVAADDFFLENLFDQSDLLQARQNYVRISNCYIDRNRASDDGGGVYATNASRLIMRRCRITSNTAINNGGGIRLTFGTHLRISDSFCFNNMANSAESPDNQAGGGGIAARNAGLLEIRRCVIRSNAAKLWAGGGLSFISSDEGLAFKILDYNRFLENQQIYRYQGAELFVDGGTEISDNEALDPPRRFHGKGGGVYIWRNVDSSAAQKKNKNFPLVDPIITADRPQLGDKSVFWSLAFLFVDSVASLLQNDADTTWDATNATGTTARLYFADLLDTNAPDGRIDDALLGLREKNNVFLKIGEWPE